MLCKCICETVLTLWFSLDLGIVYAKHVEIFSIFWEWEREFAIKWGWGCYKEYEVLSKMRIESLNFFKERMSLKIENVCDFYSTMKNDAIKFTHCYNLPYIILFIAQIIPKMREFYGKFNFFLIIENLLFLKVGEIAIKLWIFMAGAFPSKMKFGSLKCLASGFLFNFLSKRFRLNKMFRII